MLSMSSVVYGILLPAVLAGIVWGGAWRVWKRGAQPVAGGTWAGTVAVGLAIVGGYTGLVEWPETHPKLAEGWLPWIGGAAVVVGLVESFLFRALAMRAILWALLWAGVVWVLLEHQSDKWTAGEYWIWATSLAGAGAALTLALEPIALRRTGASVPVALWVWTAGIAGTLGATGCVKYGQICGALAGAMGAAVVVSWLKPSISFARGTVTAVVALAGGLLICGYYYSELPGWYAVALGAAPVVVWIGEMKIVTRRAAWVAVLIRAALIAVPVGIVAGIAGWEAWKAAQDMGH